MKLAAFSSRRLSVALTRPYAIAGGNWDAVELVVCELRTADGLCGYGQASPAEEVTGESIDVCEAALAPQRWSWLIGRSVDDRDALLAELHALATPPAARAAVDMALFDLHARARRSPVVDLLGRAHREMPTSITIGIKDVAETLAEAEEYVARGFRALKVKTGVDVELDLERLVKLRERFASSITLRADANQGYDSASLERFVARMGALELDMLEQPTQRGDEECWRALPTAVRRSIAADESVHDERDLERFVEHGAPFGIVNIKLMKCGGIAPALRLARLAQRAGVDVMWGCMDESSLGISAALHTAFASPATRYLDLDGSLDLARDLFRGGFELRADRMSTSAHDVGLGCTPIDVTSDDALPPAAPRA